MLDTKEESDPSLEVVYMETCGRNFSLAAMDHEKEYVVFVSSEGRVAESAFHEMIQYFETHKDVNIVYADEDVWMLGQGTASEKGDKAQKKGSESEENDESAHRIFPWTKPMWSPDTLFSFFYFGNIFAVRKSAYTELEWLGDEDYRKNIYDFALKATERGKRPGHIEKILFHAYKTGDSRSAIEESLMHATDFIGVGSGYDFIRERAFARRGLHARMVPDDKTGISYPIYDLVDKPLVSIVIPSKDNLEVLKQCIRSIYEHTDYPN